MKLNTLPKKLFFTSLLICVGISPLAIAGEHYRHHDHEWSYRPVYQQEIIRHHSYVYYPAQQVYFSPERNNWFWASQSGWQIGTRLPSYLNVDLRFGGIPITLRSSRPYFEHVYVENNYGRSWRESYGHRDYRNYGHHENHWSDYDATHDESRNYDHHSQRGRHER